MIEKTLKIHTCHTALQMEGGVFFKELRMEVGRGFGGLASHNRTFSELVPPWEITYKILYNLSSFLRRVIC